MEIIGLILAFMALCFIVFFCIGLVVMIFEAMVSFITKWWWVGLIIGIIWFILKVIKEDKENKSENMQSSLLNSIIKIIDEIFDFEDDFNDKQSISNGYYHIRHSSYSLKDPKNRKIIRAYEYAKKFDGPQLLLILLQQLNGHLKQTVMR